MCQVVGYFPIMEKIPALNWAVAEVIDDLRKKAGLTQGQLAGLAGLSEDYISAMERGIQSGSLTAMVHIAGALRIELAELAGLIETAMKKNPKPPKRKSGKPKK